MDEKRYGIMSITQMLDKSIYIHKQNLGTSALYLFVMSILVAVIGLIFSFIIIVPVSLLMTSSIILGNGTFESNFFISMLMLTVFLTLFYYSLESAKQSGIVTIGSNAFLRKKVDISDAIVSAFKNIFRVISVVTAGIILFLPVIVMCGWILTSIVSNGGYSLEGDTVSIVGIIVLSIVFFIGFAFFMTIHAFAIEVAIIEKLYFFKALKRSRQLVKGKFWRTFGYIASSFLLLFFINISIYTIFGLAGGIIYFVLESTGAQEELMSMLLMIGNVVRIPIQMLVSYFVAPIGGIFTIVLYYNMRFEKEGYHIALNIANLKNQQ